MPELPEVETVCRGLVGVLEGRRLKDIQVTRPDLRIPFPKNFAANLKGRRICKIYRRAKYILMSLDDGNALIIHLGMSGRMVVSSNSSPAQLHDHVIFFTDDGSVVRYNDPRRFGLMDLAIEDALDDHKFFNHLGIDPLSDDFGPGIFLNTLKGRSTAIKSALLDQRLVVGIGNIYACESLYRAGISPRRKAGSITKEQATRLVQAIKDVLTDAIAAGGSSLRDHVQPTGELGYFQHAWCVYGREGQKCVRARSGETKHPRIKRVVQGGRSTFYCPRCQR